MCVRHEEPKLSLPAYTVNGMKVVNLTAMSHMAFPEEQLCLFTLPDVYAASCVRPIKRRTSLCSECQSGRKRTFPLLRSWSPLSHQNGKCQGACSLLYHHFCQKFTYIKFYKLRVFKLKILCLGVCDSHFPHWLPGSRRKHWEGVMLTTWLSLLQFCTKICPYMSAI